MADDSTASVKIVADASGVAPGVAQAKGSIAELQPFLQQLNTQMAEMSATMRDGFAQVATALTGTKEEMHALEAETERETLSLKEMALSVNEGVRSFAEFKLGLREVAEAYAAFFGVEMFAEMAEHMGEAAEKVQHLAAEFGLSTSQVQELQGVALGTGTSIDVLTRGMALLDKNTATASGTNTTLGKALKIVGISADDGRSQMERLAVVADKFNQLPAGPERLALAMALFGRNGKEMIPILEQGSAGIQELTEKAEAYGMVNEDATARGMKLAEAVNTSKIAWDGLKTTLMDAFAPLLADMADGFQSLIRQMTASYESGAAVKQVFDAISATTEGLGAVINTLGAALRAAYDNFDLIAPVAAGFAAIIASKYVASFAEAVAVTKELRSFITALMLTMEASGSIEAFKLLLAGVAAGMKELSVVTLEATAALLASPWTWLAAAVAAAVAFYERFTEATKELTTAQNDLNKAQETLADTSADLAGKSREALDAMKEEREVALRLAEAHLKAAEAALAQATAEAQLANHKPDRDAPDASNPLGAGFQAQAAAASGWYDSIRSIFATKDVDKQTQAVRADQQAVNALKASIDQIDGAIKKASSGSFDLGLEKTPKEKKPKSDDASQSQEWKAQLQDMLLAEENWGADETALTVQFWAQKLAQVKAGTKEWAEVHKEWATATLAEFKKEQSDEISTIRQTQTLKLALAKDDADITNISLQDKLAAIDEEEKAGTISAAKAAQMKAVVNQQILQAERDYQTKIFQLQVDALQAELALQHLPYDEQKKINQQLIDLKKEFNAKMAVLEKQAGQQAQKDTFAVADAIRQKWQSIVQPIVQSFTQGLQQMITGAKNLRQVLASVGNAILSQAMNWITKQVTAFITGEGGKTAAAAAGAAARGTIEAGAATESVALSAATALKQIIHQAAVAAAGAYAAIARIPVVGPALAPIAAAAALAGVIALGKTVFSAENGADSVPYDNAPFLLHKREMVLNAPVADSLRTLTSMVQGGGVSGGFASMSRFELPAALSRPLASQMPAGIGGAPSSAGGSGGGDVHHHHHYTINAIDSQDVERFVRKHANSLAKGVNQGVRNGYKPVAAPRWSR